MPDNIKIENEVVFLDEVYKNLPRVLSLFDGDSTSKSYGMGDRYYWSWGLIDFGNATFQGAANGLSRLWVAGLWPYPTDEKKFINRIDSIFLAAKRLTRKDGSLEEAFPYEGSFCVSSLVAYDLLCTIELLKSSIDEKTLEKWTLIVKPIINFIKEADENHAIISNHLATSIAALYRWFSLVNDSSAVHKADLLLQRILKHQSSEGWYKEYDGADPGYQSLCMYYLADVYLISKKKDLKKSLELSINFLSHFIHPDGSYGGLYGSRATRFYFPAGILALGNISSQAKSISEKMIQSINRNRVVTLSSIDEPNLIPMFNCYVWAATLAKDNHHLLHGNDILPAFNKKPFFVYFKDAGIIIKSEKQYYTLISTNKGGVTYHYKDNVLAFEDPGLVIENSKGELASTQNYNTSNQVKINENQIIIKSNFQSMPKSINSTWKFLLLRISCITFFRSYYLREIIKKFLVSCLITRKNNWSATNKRSIIFKDGISIKDHPDLPKKYKLKKNNTSFISIHMASKGYWQLQDELNTLQNDSSI
tara:strand:+ start:911 stop:2515 length:1605 start_codon:yes stop_codon:yes gene_type:complete